MKVALQLQQQYRTSVCSWQGVSTNVIRDTTLLWQTTHKLFLNAEVREGEQLYAQPPEGWNPQILTDGRRVVWGVRKAMPCLFVNTELDICIGVHVDDMLVVGPSELIDKEFVAGTLKRHDNALVYGD